MQDALNGLSIKSSELCNLAMVRRVAAMLDLDTKSFSNGTILPHGWHFFMLAGETKRSELRADGFPGFGVPFPDMDLPRLLLGGRTVYYNHDILIGSELERTSFVKSVIEKSNSSGPMVIVTLQHELGMALSPDPAIIETQTYILLPAKNVTLTPEKKLAIPVQSQFKKLILPDETLLFQYSALGFNSHKIHLDRDYSQKVEGLPDLVVNGGLATLLLTEFIRKDIGLEITAIKVKHTAPLYCGQAMTLCANLDETTFQLTILDSNNAVAVQMDANVKMK